MIKAKDTQFKLDESGQIFYQPVENNPLPGKPVAGLVKGGRSLSPAIEILDGADLEGHGKDEVQERLLLWLNNHIRDILGPLAVLADSDENEPEPVRAIAAKVYEHMGIIPREMLESEIAGLDAEMRRVVRSKKIRLGPVLVFIPALNKPAAVRLRAVLWSLWHDRALPPAIPQDGMVSFAVSGQQGREDDEYYRAIAYPVYGGRAIRVDMLDRLITAVYDSADKGVFKARHEMAEWLGSSVPDLYAVLESMGHTKIHDPADMADSEASQPAEEKAGEKTEEKDQNKPAEENKPEETAQPAAKPELATFRLKRGKAYQAKEALPHGGKKQGGPRKFKSDAGQEKGGKKFKKGKGRPAQKNSTPKVISAAAPKSKPEDSPFAVLQQLKAGSKDEK